VRKGVFIDSFLEGVQTSLAGLLDEDSPDMVSG
jgi:hypothetical protein